jgi:hypothetical protein
MMKQYNFQIEPLGELKFPGWTNPYSRWNGWATPHFERDAAEAVARALGQLPGNGYSFGPDYIETTEPEHDEPSRWHAQQLDLPDGRTVEVYAIGAWAWIWELAIDWCVNHEDWFRLEHLLHPEMAGDRCIECGEVLK